LDTKRRGNSVVNGILKVEVPGNVQGLERLKFDILERILPVHVDSNIRQNQIDFICLNILGMPQVGRHTEWCTRECLTVGDIGGKF
jgi:hypothetical protein